MFDLDDGLTIESYRIPWLFWIQILIFFLLILLLCCFSLFTSDLFDNNTNTIISSSPSSSSASPSSVDDLSISHTFLNKGVFKHNTTSILANGFQHRNQVTESQSKRGEIATSTSGRIIMREDERENEGFSADALIDFHPCNYFRLAKLAFLKCFGLDPTSDNSSSSESRKDR